MRFSLSQALVGLLAVGAVSANWFGRTAYNKWHETELERWLSDNNVPYPSPSDRKDLENLVKSNWNDRVIAPYNSWDTAQLQKYLSLKGEEVKKGTEKNKDSLIEQVKASWTETEDRASDAYASVRDWIFDTWTESQLKEFCDYHGIPVPQPRTRDSVLKTVRENYQNAANKLGETAAYPGDWLFQSWSDSDLKSWLDQRGIPIYQGSKRNQLIAQVRRNSRTASNNVAAWSSSLSASGALARELQGFKGSPSPDLARPKLEVEEVTGNSSSSSSVSDGCLNFDVAKRILVALEELPVYVSYVDANLRRIWSDDSMSDFNKEVMFHIETAGVRLKLKALETGKPQTEDVAIHLPNKDHMVWWVNATPHFNEEGTVIGVSMVAVNITEQVKLKECLRRLEAEMAARRAMEEELCQAMKLTEDAIQAKNVFLAVMSHEIRTPLNGLLGLAEALETSELNVEQKELVRTIMSSSVMVADILGDILDLATMEFGMMKFEEKPFCPADLVQDVTKMALAATQEKDITVTSEIADDIPKMVCCDPLRVRQVIKYLVLNAIKFTQKGTVSIRMRVKPDPGRKVGLGTENEMKLSEHLHSMENNNTVTGVESDQHSKSAQSSSRSRNSFIDLLDMNLFQMKLLEISRSSKNDIRCAVDVSNNVRDAQRNGEKLVRLGREDTILVPVNPSTVTGQSGLLLDTSSRRKESLKHTNFEDCSASEDVETSENELCDQHLLYCEITDTGVGIAKEVFTSLFGEFTHVNDGLTRNYGGTGLGLVICRQLVELMGGQLTVESEVGNGFKFAFTVKCKVLDGTPVEMTCRRLEMSSSTTLKSTGLTSESILACTEGQSIIARKADFVSKLENNRTGGSPRILLAEDNKVNVMVAISMLKRLGFTAKVVTNGLEALEAIRKEKYDLILLDICMPLMDGLQVAYAVRKFEETGQWPDGDLSNMFSNSHSWSLDSGNTSLSQVQMNNMDGLANAIKDLTTTDPRNHIPIIAVTANALRSEIEKCFACGMDAFIAKPVVFQKLREILEIYLPQNNSQLT